MNKKYRYIVYDSDEGHVWIGEIRKVQITRESEKTIWYIYHDFAKSTVRLLKKGPRHAVFNTRKEARLYLISHRNKIINQLKEKINKQREVINKIKEL